MSRKARRRRKLGITLAGGETAPQRATGRDRRHTNQPDGPPPIMQARARRCPIDIASVLHESDMGRCILALTTGEERAACADTWAALSAARESGKTVAIFSLEMSKEQLVTRLMVSAWARLVCRAA